MSFDLPSIYYHLLEDWLTLTMANATVEAAAQAKAKTALAKALRQRNNENTLKFFAASMVGMMVLFL